MPGEVPKKRIMDHPLVHKKNCVPGEVPKKRIMDHPLVHRHYHEETTRRN